MKVILDKHRGEEMRATSYIALLRGINVGGKNKVPMAALRQYLEELGYQNVKTLIASGNVVFTSDKQPDQLTKEIEAMLPTKFALDSSLIKVLILTKDQLSQIIAQAPKDFGIAPDKYRYYVFFLMGVSVDSAMEAFELREDIDQIWSGGQAIYTQQLLAKLTQSRINKIASTPVYQSMTIRGWNTVTRLLEL
ncbi:MAG TPA: DUF1697 domain-containing protein [Verrucomicrobiae bacterium]|nr:DUF1697 domain-containing protein [Verrucomicrobiae bacterium]